MWLNNVELIAAQRIGAETVTYVSNIYKYYVAYKLAIDLQAERQLQREQLKKAVTPAEPVKTRAAK